jgi:hypothetical protein
MTKKPKPAQPAKAAPEAPAPAAEPALQPQGEAVAPLGPRAAFLARQFAAPTPPGQDRRNDRFRREQALKELAAAGGKPHELAHLRAILAKNFGDA